jgi:hypothetical protein
MLSNQYNVFPIRMRQMPPKGLAKVKSWLTLITRATQRYGWWPHGNIVNEIKWNH